MPGAWAILLAAGESTRMGRLKALLPWRGQTLLEHQVSALRDGGADRVIVVLGHRADELRPLVERNQGVTWTLNPDYRQGKTTSIKAGLSALPIFPPPQGGVKSFRKSSCSTSTNPAQAMDVARVLDVHRAHDLCYNRPRVQRQGRPFPSSYPHRSWARTERNRRGIAGHQGHSAPPPRFSSTLSCRTTPGDTARSQHPGAVPGGCGGQRSVIPPTTALTPVYTRRRPPGISPRDREPEEVKPGGHVERR